MNKETKIQREIQDYLNKNKIFNYRVNADGNTVGIPDLIACFRGRFIGIEVKTETGKLSEIQDAIRNVIGENGGLYVVARSVDDVKDIIKYINNWSL